MTATMAAKILSGGRSPTFHGRSRLLIPLPLFVWEAMARLLMLLPKPTLTTDVVTLMKRDNVVGEGALTFADLGLEPTAIEVVLPVILRSRA